MMKSAPVTASLTVFRLHTRSLRLAEFVAFLFLLLAMGLPLLFLLIGSFNLAPPGKPLFMA